MSRAITHSLTVKRHPAGDVPGTGQEKLITSLVLFPIVPILLPLETDYDNISPIYMIRILLLFYKRASYLAVRIVKCSSAMLDPSTLPLGPVEHKHLDLLNAIG
jgi:hypothetical protein